MPLITYVKSKHNISRYEKIRFSLKNKIGSRKKFRGHKTLKVAKINDFTFFGFFLFRGSEEPSEINV